MTFLIMKEWSWYKIDARNEEHNTKIANCEGPGISEVLWQFEFLGNSFQRICIMEMLLAGKQYLASR